MASTENPTHGVDKNVTKTSFNVSLMFIKKSHSYPHCQTQLKACQNLLSTPPGRAASAPTADNFSKGTFSKGPFCRDFVLTCKASSDPRTFA